MNVDEAMAYASKDKGFWAGEVHTALETLAKEVERLRSEVQRLDMAGTHSCHDDCQRLPCAQRREIERLRAELDTAKADVEQLRGEYISTQRTLTDTWERAEVLEKELAEAKAASRCPVEVLNIFEGTYESDRYIELRTDAEADTFTDWLRDRMKDKTPPAA